MSFFYNTINDIIVRMFIIDYNSLLTLVHKYGNQMESTGAISVFDK